MPDAWSPFAVHDPGDSAGYSYGSNENRLCVVHCTAGTNSYELVKWGGPDRASLSFMLYPKVGMPWQFCEIDAKTHDSPPNSDGPGFEIERMPAGVPVRPGLSGWEELTHDQAHFLTLNLRWMHEEWGYPLDLYDGPRTHGIGVPGFHGFANHGDVDAMRSDGVTVEEWAQITAGGPPAPPPRGKGIPMLVVWLLDTNTVDVWYATALLDSFTNDGPYNEYGVGPKMQGYLNDGGVAQVYGTPEKPVEWYTRPTPPGIREQLQPTLR